jgi:ABC-type bacteriocin/lantibiotic exporter with double-glycine peptidase domain
VAQVLNVPYYPQTDDGYCLPACVQMVLSYLGFRSVQDHLARELDARPPLGTPASSVTLLRSDVLDVTFTSGDLDDLRVHLAHDWPPIVFVQAGELSHWRGHVSQHAVVVVGVDRQAVYVLDPAADAVPLSIPIGDFLLAWSELDYIYALIVRAGSR